jgi:triosephosphate isomerase
VLKKSAAALNAGLIPILCIGERYKKDVEAVLAEQFSKGIAPLSADQFARIIIA